MNEEVKPSVQYGDFFGELACDGHNGPFLHEISEKNGIDTERNFPIGLRISKGEFQNELNVSILTCDTKKYGNNIDNIRKKAKENDELEVTEREIKISFDDLIKQIKRLDIVSKVAGVSDLKFIK